MTELKTQALSKMLDEMNKPHDEVLDYIHNVLCESEDEELFAGIMVEGKTIASAFNKMMELAKKAAKSGAAFFSPQKGMDIVIDYFKGKDTEVKPIIEVKFGVVQSSPNETAEQVKNKTEAIVKKHEAQKKAAKPEVMMNIFDFLEPPVKTQTEIIAEIKAEAKANAWEEEANEGDEEVEDEETNTED